MSAVGEVPMGAGAPREGHLESESKASAGGAQAAGTAGAAGAAAGDTNTTGDTNMTSDTNTSSGFEKLFERLDALEKRLAAIAEREEPKGKPEGREGARAIAGSRGAVEPQARTLGEVRERMSRKYELASDW